MGQITADMITSGKQSKNETVNVPIKQVIQGDSLNDGYRVHFRPTRTPQAYSPHMATENVRFRSFNGCYPRIRTDLVQMVQAGFYYSGIPNFVRCYSCNGGLENWAPNKNPWIEHAKFYPECHHLRNVKGQLFIDGIQKTFAEECKFLLPTFPRTEPTARTPVSCFDCGKSAEVLFLNCYHMCACAECVKEMTFCPKCHVKFEGYVKAYLP
jgi:hypothetical protein